MSHMEHVLFAFTFKEDTSVVPLCLSSVLNLHFLIVQTSSMVKKKTNLDGFWDQKLEDRSVQDRKRHAVISRVFSLLPSSVSFSTTCPASLTAHLSHRNQTLSKRCYKRLTTHYIDLSSALISSQLYTQMIDVWDLSLQQIMDMTELDLLF